MKNRLFILVCFLFTAAFVSAQKTTTPTFKTVLSDQGSQSARLQIASRHHNTGEPKGVGI